ncbi:MAG: hypothetical protein AAF597_09345 [Bacteroidota bacterium]
MASKYVKPVLFSLTNGLVMLLLALFWLSLPRTFGDEAFLIKWTSLVKKTVLGIDPKPPAESFLYVDVSRTKSIIPEIDPLFEDFTGYNHVAITDRALLAEFLNYIRAYGTDVPLVLMDINFSEVSPADSLLQAAIDSLSFPVVAATTPREMLDTIPPPIRVPSGVAMYLSVDENFMKYPLFFNDSLPTLPLVALHEAEGVTYGNASWGKAFDGRRSLSNPIIDFRVRPHDLDVDQRYSLFDLGSLLFQFTFWEEADIRELLSGKTIVLGDYYNDKHQTVFGTVPGPMIVHNALLTLQERETLIHLRWLLLLMALFFWMSWRIWHEEQAGSRSWLWSRSQTALGKIVADSIDDTFFLILGTIASYLFFNIHINILILLIYLKMVAWVLRRFVFRKRLLEEE